METFKLAAASLMLVTLGCNGQVASPGEDPGASGALGQGRGTKGNGDSCDTRRNECAAGLFCGTFAPPEGNCTPYRTPGTIGQACRAGANACDAGLACDRDTEICLGLEGAHFCFDTGLAYGGYSSACAGSLHCVRDVCSTGTGPASPFGYPPDPPQLAPCPITDACPLANGTLTDNQGGCACGNIYINPWTEDCVDAGNSTTVGHSFPSGTDRCNP